MPYAAHTTNIMTHPLLMGREGQRVTRLWVGMSPFLMVREGDKGGGRNVPTPDGEGQMVTGVGMSPLLMVREGGTDGDKGGGRNDPLPDGEIARERG